MKLCLVCDSGCPSHTALSMYVALRHFMHTHARTSSPGFPSKSYSRAFRRVGSIIHRFSLRHMQLLAHSYEVSQFLLLASGLICQVYEDAHKHTYTSTGLVFHFKSRIRSGLIRLAQPLTRCELKCRASGKSWIWRHVYNPFAV